jgi:two-component system chemotaxis response regulator CheY
MNCKDVNVLVVDDSRVMRRIIVKCLADMGVQKVYESENGRTALDLLVENGSIDLILSDWSMPCLSGLDFLKEVRSQSAVRDIPFVLLTAEAQVYTIRMAFKARVSSYMTKPFTPAYFRYVVRRVLKENYADFC